MNKQVTREDVAREAGVSVAAVSRALNNSGYVKKEKKEHIIEVATRMGYNPRSNRHGPSETSEWTVTCPG